MVTFGPEREPGFEFTETEMEMSYRGERCEAWAMARAREREGQLLRRELRAAAIVRERDAEDWP